MQISFVKKHSFVFDIIGYNISWQDFSAEKQFKPFSFT